MNAKRRVRDVAESESEAEEGSTGPEVPADVDKKRFGPDPAAVAPGAGPINQ